MNLHRILTIFALPALLALPLASPASPTEKSGIAWERIEDGNVDAAFAKARASGKPVFLYWGAVWCPPCNQVKATVFNRPDFIARSKGFVPVYLDGDSPGAQKLGTRFAVRGYPTMILFAPNGTELTRLPGEVDAAKYMQVLNLGLSNQRPVKQALALALAGSKEVPAQDWRMLAYYSWDTDEAQVVPEKELPATLEKLAQACPASQREASARLGLRALVAGKGTPIASAEQRKTALIRVQKVLMDPALARENFDILSNYSAELLGAVTEPKSTTREVLRTTWLQAMDKLASDASLSTADQLTAIAAKVALFKLDAAKDAALPPSLLAQVKDAVQRADKATTSDVERQSVIPTAADLLEQAGMIEASDALLKAELPRSHSPYYHMLGLAGNAKARGDKAAAVDWAQKAYEAAKGPATRLQWGASYVSYLVDLAQQDQARVEAAAASVLAGLEPRPDTFYERNARSLQKVGKKLNEWNKDGSHAESVKRLQAQLDGVCSKLPEADPAKAVCSGAFVASVKKG
jgi:thioredoxin-related protein